ncbi:hypothetical protein DEO23_10860 [Brachybacterium endophyticum]|uniref:Uncharacterized protein n=1 Tax=Brachybacterium endophyticum TaxID=2182385 RepID=A0A2U2RIU6_9MICO|nr:hypothetical protein [Brachybacterium endophyticum]PWH05705.1 hypothetical protein DEO23_10860 [Brachybacterium endophyticum]
MSSLPEPDDTGAHPGPDAIALPRAAALVLWSAAYLRGDIGPDDAAVLAQGSGHRQVGGGGEDLFDWMTALRRLPLAQVHLVLPAPGRITGLVGPPEAVASALESEQAVVVSAAGMAEHTLVPIAEALGPDGTRGTLVSWRRIAARGGAPAPVRAFGGARETFLRALQQAASGTLELDLVPEEAIPLQALPATWTSVPLPRHVGAPAEHLLTLAARTLLLADQELWTGSEHTHALSEDTERREVLHTLRDEAREAIMETVGLIISDELG